MLLVGTWQSGTMLGVVLHETCLREDVQYKK